MQILLLIPRVNDYFANFVRSNGPLAVVVSPDLFNPHNQRAMVKTTIGKHQVEYYDTIDELPIVRFHKYQKMLLVDAGIGSDISAFDQRIEKAQRFILSEKSEQARQELENLRQCVYLIQNGLSPKHLAFAALVFAIDGVQCTDLSDDALRKVCETFADAPENDLTAQLEAVKKKIDGELMLYFPSIFNDSEVKEYYDILRKRTLEILKGIVNGVSDPGNTDEVQRLTTALITYSNPQTFTGSEGVEVQFDRQFENLCLVLSEQVHVDPKKYTVLEFYNAFDFVKEKAKQAEKAQKRAYNGR